MSAYRSSDRSVLLQDFFSFYRFRIFIWKTPPLLPISFIVGKYMLINHVKWNASNATGGRVARSVVLIAIKINFFYSLYMCIGISSCSSNTSLRPYNSRRNLVHTDTVFFFSFPRQCLDIVIHTTSYNIHVLRYVDLNDLMNYTCEYCRSPYCSAILAYTYRLYYNLFSLSFCIYSALAVFIIKAYTIFIHSAHRMAWEIICYQSEK